MHIRFRLLTAAALVAMPLAAQQPALRAIVPVVGSNPGAHGAVFKTSLQLHNRTPREMRGSMVIRPAGAASEADNRLLPYVLAPHQTVSFEDVVASAGIEGLGSMDFVIEQGGVPTIVARAYDFQGPNGTSGVSVPPVAPADALTVDEWGSLIVPADLERFRFNIGVRALDEGARVVVIVYDEDGNIEANLGQRSFAPHSFSQRSGAQFLGRDLAPNQSIAFLVTEGSAIVYGTTTDNRTNDPSLQIVRGGAE